MKRVAVFLCITIGLSTNIMGIDGGRIDGGGVDGGWAPDDGTWCIDVYLNFVPNHLFFADIGVGYAFSNDSSFLVPSLGLKKYVYLKHHFELELKGAVGIKMKSVNFDEIEYGYFVESGILLPTFKRLPKLFIGFDYGTLFSFSEQAVIRVKFGLFFPCLHRL